MTVQGIPPESNWLGSAFLKDYKIICKIKMRENENKLIIGDLNCTMDKIDR